ncbi:MAG: hypothetical protein K2J11_08590 [Oscillospiraceae bacterium]|nr:hypothetical protein [Oscillospiraceae bacterium]
MKQQKKVKQNEKLRLMKKRFDRALALVGILVMALSLSGCEKLAETNVSTETKGAKQAVGEITASVNSEETAVVPDFEITDWTMKDLVTDMEIEGCKFSLPCTVSDINEKCDVKYTTFMEERQLTGGALYLDQKDIASVYFNGDVDKEISVSNICYFFMGGFEYDLNDKAVKTAELPEFNVMGITNKSTRSDVINILGNPNMRVGESDRHFQYGFSENEYIIIDFSEEDPDKMYLFFIIYNTEE